MPNVWIYYYLVEALVVTTIQTILEQLKNTLIFITVEPDKAKVFDILAELAKSGECMENIKT